MMIRNSSLRIGLFALLAGLMPCAPAAMAQGTPPARPAATATDPLQIAIGKSNAYIALMNRTLRAVDSWNRYTSWVDLKAGPTGKERYITYGLYTLYDVRGEIAKARDFIDKQPITPELDASIGRYAAAYEALAPLITRAAGYYERQDYRDDKMAEGKALHAQLVPAAAAFLKERDTLEKQMRAFTADINQRELTAIEAREGKQARWQIKNVMIAARQMIDMVPSQKQPVVDIKAFDEALAAYAATVRAFDGYIEANPGKVKFMESQPRSLLSKLRDYRDKLARTKGDGRRAGDTTWIISDYNSMTSLSETANRF
jgi:hypothetical protein